jgi:hypothetical protein
MTNSIFDKTDKGREEIATRKHQLASRLRTLLLLIDGKHSTEDLLQKVTGIGLTADSLTELLNDGFIHAVAEAPAPAGPAVKQEKEKSALASSTARTLPDGQTQFEAIYHFYTETIKSTIGLRGYALQLKVEKAGSIEEFRELRRPYLEAVLKAKGNEMAKSLRGRLDELLYYGETAPPNTTIIDLNTNPLE